MAANPPPPFVLLDRVVCFGIAGLAIEREQKEKEEAEEAAAAMIGAGRWTGVVLPPAGTPPSAMRAINPVMKPVPVLADPPRPSSLCIMLPADAPTYYTGVGEISSTHRGILVIRMLLDGYLLYDVPTNALTAIPPLPDSLSDPTFVPLGPNTAVLVGDGGDDYILAEIVTSYNRQTFDLALPEVKIFAWSSKNAGKGKWVQSSISQLPLPAHLCGPDYHFQIDMTFSFQGRICWVDLLQGILLCDGEHLLEEGEGQGGPKLSFIPLPLGYAIDVHRSVRHTVQSLYQRSMACVSGVIKFVALVGYGRTSDENVMLRTWALSPDFKHWTEDTTALSVGDIWASDSFNQMELPHVMPISPVLSMTEDGIMYAILNVIELEPLEQLNDFGEVLGNRVLAKANYIISFDIRRNKVLSSIIPSNDGDLRWIQPNLLATDFSAYLQS